MSAATPSDDAWSAGQSYDHYMGRWSALIADIFLDWLDAPTGLDWLELGCGTGALTRAILNDCAPKSVLATDASEDFIAHARASTKDRRVRFEVADARALPVPDHSVDVVTSALMLNFVPGRDAALAEMRRALRKRGLLSFYVWDYPGGGIGLIDAFWKTAAELDPAATALDEALRFPFCTQEGLQALADNADLSRIEVAPIETETHFDTFDAFWHPFTLGAGPAPAYAAQLDAPMRERLKQRLRQRVGDGPIRLPARAWAVRGVV